ncbi:LuxR C-terminal-related transcriptional regulator [Desulfomonile tiedjei]|uniref:PAS domain S-box n=1 Tax=Desulfomonile tiedjei (strain ATCC 49306 / DSM 6799 / DCB-1) TaxID=706587 RepID=I4CCC0_DESTA|nr:LuxR C-terminal-related transcriptional regulator [Desulfomonile tiedjei]AFM27211.1 PAS domain S-box [Desulfomonile tiedjei DSM 6799]
MEELSFHDLRNRSACSGESEILHSETRVRQGFLEKCSADSYVIYDLRGTPQQVSTNFSKTFGWSLEELKDQGNLLVPDSERECLLSGILSARDGNPKWLVTRRLTKPGELLDIAFYPSPILDNEGQCIALLVIHRNLTQISEWKIIRDCPGEELISEWGFQQEQLSLQHVHEHRILFDKHSIGLAIVDLMGTCIRMNAEFAHALDLNGDNSLDSEALRSVFCTVGLWDKTLSSDSPDDCVITYKKTDDISMLLRIRTSLGKRRGSPNTVIALAVSDILPRHDTAACIQQDTRSPETSTALEEPSKDSMHNTQLAQKSVQQSVQHLMKTNGAVKKVLQLHQEYKNDIQERIQQNLRLAVLPILDELKKIETSASHKHLIDILDFNLRHIMSPFGAKILSFENKLTKRELQICHMIRAGKNSREIAAGLNLTYETVIVHRKNIRKKLGLKNEKSSLIGYLKKWA